MGSYSYAPVAMPCYQSNLSTAFKWYTLMPTIIKTQVALSYLFRHERFTTYLSCLLMLILLLKLFLQNRPVAGITKDLIKKTECKYLHQIAAVSFVSLLVLLLKLRVKIAMRTEKEMRQGQQKRERERVKGRTTIKME